MNKTLLVLGASTYQVPTILKARELGYRVVTTDNIPSNPGHRLAHCSYNVDTTDSKGVLSVAKKENIDGVITPGTDVAVMTAAYIAEQLDIVGPPFEAARILTQKRVFREFLASSNLPCPSFVSITKAASCPGDLFDGRTWIIKPNRSSGSKGIFMITCEAEYLNHVDDSLSFSADGTAVIEEFIQGTQHTCEGVLSDGSISLALLTDRDTAPPPYTATTGHRVPSLLSTNIQQRILDAIEQAFRLLGISSGPFDCDLVVDKERIVILEMTPRLGGNSLSRLFDLSLDYDLINYAIRYACGDTFSAPFSRDIKPACIAILGAIRSGKISWDQSEERSLQQEPWVRSLILDVPQGAEVKQFINGRHRVGEALIIGSDRTELDKRILALTKRLAITTD